MKNRLWFIGLIAALFLLGGSMAATIAASSASAAGAGMVAVPTAPQSPLAYTTVITVNTTEDTSGETQTRTCYFTQSIYFAATDGKCNLRRALVEASHRPEAHRPILIKFNIPLTDTNYNPITGTWTIVMDGDYSSSAGGEALVQGGLDNPKNPDSYVTIDGATQGEIGGRSNGDPIIIIHSEYVLDLVGVNYNTLRNLAFNGGGGIFSNDVSDVGGYNLIENVWVGLNADGTEIVPGSNPNITLAGGGISVQGDNNTISNTIVTGSNTGISIEGHNNLVQYNTIGTRGDRTIPAERLTCVASNLYNPAQWYGGWGIKIVNGNNNQIVHNRIAGAHSPHSPTETAPPAIWTAGGDVLVAYNTIGIDGDGVEVGTCGQGIFVTGQGVQVLNNTIVNARTSFFVAESDDPTEGAIFVNDSSPLALQYVIRDNVVRDSTSKVIEFGPAIPESLRLFEPPIIISIDGLTVIGETETGYDCPGCLVDLYLDDLDDEQDALELLTTAVIDNIAGVARFTATLPYALPANHGIRVAAVTQGDYVIGSYLSGTTTMLSPAYTPDATFVRALAPGWNLFSIDVTPPNPAIGVVLASLAGQYDVVLSFDGGPSGGGRTYDPANPGASDLTTIDVTHGYWIHITAATTQTLTLAYEPARDDTPIQLYEGWNLVSYLPDRTLPVTQALESISGAYDIVRSFDGGALTHMPAQPQFSDLTEMEPGYAYWIKIKTGQGAPVLTYPGADTPILLSLDISEPATPAQPQGIASADFFSPTTEWTDFYGVATLSGFSALRNASVVAYDPDGNVAGAFTVHTPPYYGFLHVYLDDPNTPGDEGITDGDEVRFTINGRLATPSKSTVWNTGVDANEVNLNVVMPYVTTDVWADFWGTLTIDGAPAPAGTILAAYDADGVYSGDVILDEAGQFGFLHAYGDDATTVADEGAEIGDAITFKAFLPLSTYPVILTPSGGAPTWQGRGARTQVALSGEAGTPGLPTLVTISGPTVGAPNVAYTFTIIVDPIDVTLPITYHIEHTDLATPIVASLDTRAIYLKNRIWTTEGDKVITVTATNAIGSATGVYTITIVEGGVIPLIGVEISGPAAGLVDTAYTFTATVQPPNATPPITYTWTPAPDSGQGTAYATYTWTNAGTHQVSVTADNGGSATDSHTIVISVPAEPEVFIVPPLGGVWVFTDTLGLTARIDIAKATVSETTTFTYTWLSTPRHPAASGFSFAGRSFDLSASGPINKPIEIGLEYREQDWIDAGIQDETSLRLHYWNAGLGTWDDVINLCPPSLPLPYGPDTTLNVFRAPLCHLSEFGMFGKVEQYPIYLPLVLRNH